MDNKTLALAKQELEKYSLQAEFVIENPLPSFEIRCLNGKITIAAPDAVEVLYGVYDLAERIGGYCFFEPGRDRFDESRIQTPADGILVPCRKPLLKRRGFIQEFPFNDETLSLFDWMAKNKLNYLLTWMKYYDELSPEVKEYARIRGIVIESGHHNFNYWIPGRKYNKAHPEFFAEINGKRIESSDGKSELLLSEQLCTTNPELRAEIVKNMLKYSDEHPEVKAISLIPNDGFGWCECSECSKFYDKSKKGDFYSLSEHVYKADRIYHDLLRDVGGKLHAARSDLMLTFCAYINYCAPSPGFTLENGMAVHMATYWRCINHTMDDTRCVLNPHYLEDIKRWTAAKRGGEVNIYEYFMGVNFYLMLPMIHFRELFHEMKCYSDIGVDGILTQFHVSHWSVYGMNYVLMGRAARGEDQDESIENLFLSLFGADAEEAKNFYREVKALVQNAGHCHIPYPRALLRRTELNAYQHLHELALKLSEKSPEDRFRSDLVIWTDYMIRFKKLFDSYQSGYLTEADIHTFLAWIHSHQDTRVFVVFQCDDYFHAVLEALRTGKEWIHFNLEWEDKYILKHDQILG